MRDDEEPFATLPGGGLAERLAELRARWTTGQLAAGALLCVGIAAATFAVLRPGASAPPAELSIPMASASPASGPSTTTPTQLVVHAAGAVSAPGVYRLAPGSRVADLVAAAGGLAEGADPDRVNLAAPLADGEQVVVPRVGEPLADGSSGAATGPVDLNTATAEQLETLPGIGPATAKAIVADRERNGPFRSVDDLERVRGIGKAKVDALRDSVRV